METVSSERPKMCRAPTFKHLSYFLLEILKDLFAIYNDSKYLKKAAHKHESMPRRETRKLGGHRGNWREKCYSPVSRGSALEKDWWPSVFLSCVLGIHWTGVWFKRSILVFRPYQAIKRSLAFWMPHDKIREESEKGIITQQYFPPGDQ